MKRNKIQVKRFQTKRNKLVIRGRVYGECSGHKPAVILSHGFIANQSMCKKYAICLAELGYITFTFDFCGGGLMNSSDGKTSDMSIFTEMEDLEAIIKYVKKLPFIDHNRINLLGCSQGGVVSAMVAKKNPDAFEKLILFYPALCIPDDARKGKMIFAKFDPDNIPEKLWCGPMRLGKCYVDTVKKMNIYDEIGGFDGKVFYIHGTADHIVDISYARKAYKLYPNIEYYEIEHGAHGFKGEHDEIAVKYLKKFMK